MWRLLVRVDLPVESAWRMRRSDVRDIRSPRRSFVCDGFSFVKIVARDEAEKKRAYLIVSNALAYCDVLVLAL